MSRYQDIILNTIRIIKMIDFHLDEAYFNQSSVIDDDIPHNIFTIILKFHDQSNYWETQYW